MEGVKTHEQNFEIRNIVLSSQSISLKYETSNISVLRSRPNASHSFFHFTVL